MLLASISLMIGGASCGDEDAEVGANIGQSGLSRSLLLSDLYSDQKLTLCQWQEDLFTKGMCPASAAQSDKRPPIAAAECVAKHRNYVPYSLGSYEDCVIAISLDMCATEYPVACEPLLDFMEANSPPVNWCGGVMCFP